MSASDAQPRTRVFGPHELPGAPAAVEAMGLGVGLDPTTCADLAATVAKLLGPDTTLHLRTSHPIEGGPFVEVVALGSALEHGETWSAPGHARVTMIRRGAPAEERPTLGYVGVPYPGERLSGDGVWLDDRRTHLRLAVIDGLGHGKGAHDATAAALAVLESTRQRPLDATIATLHEALRNTRGAAIGLGELDRATRRFEWVGIGNIAGLICDPPGPGRSVASHNGTLGQRILRAPSITYDWPAGACALFHSDGVGSSYQLAQYPQLARHHPALVASVLYRDWARTRDDATVLVVRDG